MEEHKKKGKRSPLARALLAVLLLFLLIGGAAGFYTLHMLGRIERVDSEQETWIAAEEEDFEADDPEDPEAGGREDTLAPEKVVWRKPSEPVQEARVHNILLIGQDRRPGETRARSDSMILCSINEDTKTITLTSLMRDMYVPFPGKYSDNRINAAYAFGGMSLLDQLIEEDFGVTIDGNVEVDFDGFVAVMDLIAPLEIELNRVEAGYLNKFGDWYLHEGVNAMTGEQLLMYARTRHVGHADWERTERQRRVLTTAFEKVKGMSLRELRALAEAALPCMTTDLTNAEILQLIYTVAINRISIGETYRLPVEGTYTNEIIRGMMVLLPDLQENSRLLQEYVYGQGDG